MVFTRGHGVRNVASHSLHGSDGAQHPGDAAVLGNVNGSVSTSRKRIGSERRSHHDLGVDSLNGEERLTVLIRLPAETRWNQVHNFNRGRLPTDENESCDHHERGKHQKAQPEGSESFHSVVSPEVVSPAGQWCARN